MHCVHDITNVMKFLLFVASLLCCQLSEVVWLNNIVHFIVLFIQNATCLVLLVMLSGQTNLKITLRALYMSYEQPSRLQMRNRHEMYQEPYSKRAPLYPASWSVRGLIIGQWSRKDLISWPINRGPLSLFTVRKSQTLATATVLIEQEEHTSYHG